MQLFTIFEWKRKKYTARWCCCSVSLSLDKYLDSAREFASSMNSRLIHFSYFPVNFTTNKRMPSLSVIITASLIAVIHCEENNSLITISIAQTPRHWPKWNLCRYYCGVASKVHRLNSHEFLSTTNNGSSSPLVPNSGFFCIFFWLATITGNRNRIVHVHATIHTHRLHLFSLNVKNALVKW